MNKTFQKQIDNIDKKEKDFLNKQKNQWMSNNINPLLDKVMDKIPVKLKDTLNLAFYKGFELVFEKGNKFIEMTYNKENLEFQHELNNYAVDHKFNKKYINKLDRPAMKSKALNTTISMAEGSILGALGIGLPDIPLFIAVIIKSIYEIALSYGFNYESEEEKCYILLIICGALTKEEKQKAFHEQLIKLENDLDNNVEPEVSLKGQMKITSDILSDSLLAAKFIQGFPVVGAVGGLVNMSTINKIGKYATIKYKKRYLLSKTKKNK